MNSAAPAAAKRPPTDWRSVASTRRKRRRHASERLFHALGLGAIVLSTGVLLFLLGTMAWNGWRGFTRVEVAVPVDLRGADLPVSRETLRTAGSTVDLNDVAQRAAVAAYGSDGARLLADDAGPALARAVARDPSLLDRPATVALPVSPAFIDATDGRGDAALRALHERLREGGAVHRRFDGRFLSAGDATEATRAGVGGALRGSLITMAVTLLLAFPLGVAAAVYLEEFSPRNRWTDTIEVSVNNLAAVPSIIFGLLGLSVFLNTWNLPRSAPLVGGMTLALMTMPVIVIASRNALRSVPPSVRDAAYGVGASPMQVVFHHVLPLALPGVLTGTIIGMARALGETAPLLMIGMRAFVTTPPTGLTDPSSVLPVQIFLWSDEIGRGFVEKTSAAIIVLLVFLLLMNGVAIWLRNRFETRW